MDIDDLIEAMENQVDPTPSLGGSFGQDLRRAIGCLESIAKSLEQIANPMVVLDTGITLGKLEE